MATRAIGIVTSRPMQHRIAPTKYSNQQTSSSTPTTANCDFTQSMLLLIASPGPTPLSSASSGAYAVKMSQMMPGMMQRKKPTAAPMPTTIDVRM